MKKATKKRGRPAKKAPKKKDVILRQKVSKDLSSLRFFLKDDSLRFLQLLIKLQVSQEVLDEADSFIDAQEESIDMVMHKILCERD